MSTSVLTACTANICRSPLAKAALRQLCPDVNVSSAGLHALVRRYIDADVASAAQQFQISLRKHFVRQSDEIIGKAADIILVIETHHRLEIAKRWPHFVGKAFLMGHFQNSLQVPDPFRRGTASYLRAAELIFESAETCAKNLKVTAR